MNHLTPNQIRELYESNDAITRLLGPRPHHNYTKQEIKALANKIIEVQEKQEDAEWANRIEQAYEGMKEELI